MASNYIQEVKTIDETIYDLMTKEITVINGNKNLQIDLINGAAVGTNPKFTDNNTTYSFASGTGKFTVTSSDGNTTTVTITPSIATASAYGAVKLGSVTQQTTAAVAVSTTSNRTYAIQTNSSGQLVVNVPWINTYTDEKVKQTACATNAQYKLLFTTTASPTSGNAYEAYYDVDLTYNPSSNLLTLGKIAVSSVDNLSTIKAGSSNDLMISSYNTIAPSVHLIFNDTQGTTSLTGITTLEASTITATTINGVSLTNSPKFTDANVAQIATTNNLNYEVIFSGTNDNTTRTEGVRKTSTLTFNPSTKVLKINSETAATQPWVTNQVIGAIEASY